MKTEHELAQELAAVQARLNKIQTDIKANAPKTVCAILGVSAVAVAESLAQSSIEAGVDGARSTARALPI